MTRYRRKYRRIARSLSRADLMRRSMDLTFTADDIDPAKWKEDRRFLDFYSEEGIRLALRQYGLIDALARRGYTDLDVHTRTNDERHTLLVTGAADDLSEPANLLELVVRRDRLVGNAPEGTVVLTDELEVLTVDWLSLRHPRGAFSRVRPRLPGQDAPGLGVGERVLELLYQVTIRLRLDTLVNVPLHFHNAVLYARELPFLDPCYAGQLACLSETLMRDEGLSLAEASWAIDWGHVQESDGSPFTWRGELMVWPHGEVLHRHLDSHAYRDEVARVHARERYTLDRPAFDATWADGEAALLGARNS